MIFTTLLFPYICKYAIPGIFNFIYSSLKNLLFSKKAFNYIFATFTYYISLVDPGFVKTNNPQP